MGYYEDLDLSDDLLVMYGLSSGVLKVTGEDDLLLDGCVLDEPARTREMDVGNGQVVQIDSLKIWPAKYSPKPPLGSVVVAHPNDTYWTILTCLYKHQVKCWECGVRDLSIVTSTLNTATVVKMTYGHGRGGEARAKPQGYFSGQWPATAEDTVQAHFQSSPEIAAIKFGSEFTRTTYRVFFANPIPLPGPETLAGGAFRLVDSTGNVYRILTYNDKSRIDKLAVAEAILITEGREWFAGPMTPLPNPVFPNPTNSP